MAALKLTGCMNIVTSMDEADQDALLDRLDRYTADGIPSERAQVMAASDTLAELEAERKEFMAMLREQHPDLFLIKPQPVGDIKQSQQRDPKKIFGRDIAPLAIKAYKSLSDEARTAVDAWNVNWSTGPLVKAFSEDTKLADEVRAAFEPVRDKLRKVYGDTVPLYRGERTKGNSPSKDSRTLYSWTPIQDLAKQYALDWRGGMPKAILDKEIDAAVSQYERTGFVKFRGQSFAKMKDDPGYFNIYDKNRQIITDGDDLRDLLKSDKESRDEWISELRQRGNAYSANVPVDNLVWIPVGLNLEHPEIIAEYNPRINPADELKLSKQREITETPAFRKSADRPWSTISESEIDEASVGYTEFDGFAFGAGWMNDLRASNPGAPEPTELDVERESLHYTESDGFRHGAFWAQDELARRNPGVFKSAVGGDFDGTNPDITKSAQRNSLGFYSALAKGIEDMPTKAALAGAWKSQINGLVKKGAAKQDEVTWSGIEDFLDLQEGKITKEQIGEYLKANGVQVEEVVLGDAGKPLTLEEWIKKNHPDSYDELMEYREANNAEDFLSLKATLERNWKAGMGARTENPTKYSQYTLPGDENYREVLLTLPEKDPRDLNVIAQELYGKRFSDLEDDEANRVASAERNEKRAENYRSSHWDQPNVLAHIRVNDRVDAEGAKTLLVEEIQSDWGQDGKKKGFASNGKLPDGWSVHQDGKTGEWYVIDKTNTQTGLYAKTREEAIANATGSKTLGIPTAPFVTKTDGWLNLALKRVIAMAVDGGYQKVAFVNGDQSADRYDLSKQIGSIAYTPEENILDAWDNNRRKVMRREITDESQLEEHIGKEVAKRLLAQPLVMGKHLLDGEDIKVGGEGMKTFYDAIVPNATKALLKKLGGGQMESVTIEVGAPRANSGPGAAWNFVQRDKSDQPGFTITDKMREHATNGLPLFSRQRQTDTDNFKKWSNDAPLVKLGEKHEFRSGQPVVVEALHGTTNSDLTEFKRERANIESDWGAGFYASNTPDDVATNYANNDGADLTQRIELLAERLAVNEFDDDMDAARGEAKTRLTQESPNTLKLYVRMKNPAVLGGKGETFFDYNEEYNEDTEEYGEPTGSLVDFVNALDEAGDGLDISMRDLEDVKAKIWEAAEGDGLKLGELARIVKETMVDTSSLEDGSSGGSEVLRQALDGMGFDGVIDTTVSDKFGPKVVRNGQAYDRAGGMKGMTKDTVHFIAFNPEQLKSATGNNGDYSESRNITKSAQRQTETPQFKKWFGDSKVVDADGEPLVVYHGTNDNFTKVSFKKGAQGLFWFTSDKDSITDGQSGAQGVSKIKSLYAKIKNPAGWTEYDKFSIGELRARGFDGVILPSGEGQFDGFVFKEPTQIKSATGNNGDFDGSNPDIRKSTGRTSTGADWDSPSASKFDDMVYKFQDKQVDLKRVIESVKVASGAIADDLNVYLQEELYHGRTAKRTEDFVNMELTPLIEEMRKDGLELTDVEEYLHARHAPEANKVIAERNPGAQDLQDGGSGMTTQAALNYMSTLPADLKQKLESAASKVDSIIAKTRQMYVDYELESKSTVAAWDKMFDHYIPLQREDKEGKPGLGQGFSVKGRETKGRTGSTRKVVDILANVALQREKAIVRGEKNRVSRALVGLANSNPNEDFWTVDEVPTERVFNPDTGLVEMRADPLYKSRENVVVSKIADANGVVKEHAVLFNEEDPRALRMAVALKNLDAVKLEGVLGISAKISRYFAAINTQLNPVFGVVNLVRDVQGALLNLSSTPLKGDEGKIAKYTASALSGVYSDARAARNGKGPTSAWAALWDEFQEVGGQTGYRDLYQNSADRADAIKKALNPDAWMDSKLGKIFTANGALKVPLSEAMKGAGWIFSWISDYNLAMENGVRLAAYKAGLERGMSKEQAASAAKNLTVNFNRKGQASQQAGAMYAFFNASVQGTARIFETVLEMEPGKPKTIRLSPMGKKIVYGGIMLGSIQAMTLAAAGFSDEDPPDFVRERSLIIPVSNGKYITIPMPLGFHVLPSIGRITTEFALSGFKNPHKRALSLASLFADTLNPIGNAGLSMQTLAPTALDPFVALTENRDYTGKPIARESSNKAIPGHALGRDTATSLAKMLSEGINTLSGGNKYTSGVFSPTPDQIDYLLGQVTGGVGRELSKVEQSMLSTARGEDLPTYKIPLAGRFFGDSKSQASEGTEFYANSEKLNRLETEIKGLQKDGKSAEAAALRKASSESYLITMANQAERQIQKLRSEKHELIKADAPREQVKLIEEKITGVMGRLNRAMESLEHKQAN